MACHPSHWLSYFSRWLLHMLKPPTSMGKHPSFHIFFFRPRPWTTWSNSAVSFSSGSACGMRSPRSPWNWRSCCWSRTVGPKWKKWGVSFGKIVGILAESWCSIWWNILWKVDQGRDFIWFLSVLGGISPGIFPRTSGDSTRRLVTVLGLPLGPFLYWSLIVSYCHLW